MTWLGLLLLALLFHTTWQHNESIQAASPLSNSQQISKHLDMVISFVEGLDDLWKPLPAYDSFSDPPSRFLFFQSAYMKREVWKEMEGMWAGVMDDGAGLEGSRMLRIVVMQANSSSISNHAQFLAAQLQQLLSPLLSSMNVNISVVVDLATYIDRISPPPHILVLCTDPYSYTPQMHRNLLGVVSGHGVLVLSYLREPRRNSFKNLYQPFPNGVEGSGGVYLYSAPTDVLVCVLNKPMAYHTWGSAVSMTSVRDFFAHTQVFEHSAHPDYVSSHLQRRADNQSEHRDDDYAYSFMAQQMGYVWMQVLASTLFSAAGSS